MQDDKRVNSFADIELDDLKPKTKPSQKPSKELVDKVAESTGFVSRQPKEQRRTRFKTGRNVQLNIKVTQNAYDDFYELADHPPQPLGAVFEEAIQALKDKRAKENKSK